MLRFSIIIFFLVGYFKPLIAQEVKEFNSYSSGELNSKKIHTDLWVRSVSAEMQNVIGPAVYDKPIMTKTFSANNDGSIFSTTTTFKAHNPDVPSLFMPSEELRLNGLDTTLIKTTTWTETALGGTLRVEEKSVAMGQLFYSVLYYDVERISVGESSTWVTKKMSFYTKDNQDGDEVFSYAIEYDIDTYFIPELSDIQIFYPEIRYFYSDNYETETGAIGRGIDKVAVTEHREINESADSIIFWRNFHFDVNGKDTTTLAYASFSSFEYRSIAESDTIKQTVYSMEFANSVSDEYFGYDSRTEGFIYAPADYLENPAQVFNRKVEFRTVYQPRIEGPVLQEFIGSGKSLANATNLEVDFSLTNKNVVIYDSFKRVIESYAPINGSFELRSRFEQFFTYQNNTARVDSAARYGFINGSFSLTDVTRNFLDNQTRDSLVVDYGNSSFITVNEYSNVYPEKLPLNNGETVSNEIIDHDVQSFELAQNFPNPFNPTTTIGYSIPKAGEVQIEIINVLGQKVYSLMNPFSQSGYHQIQIDASNWASGIYFYRVTSGNQSLTKKMLLLK
jgi:hypothetical protein